MRKLLAWIRCSGIWITFIGNPFHWDFQFQTVKKDKLSGRDVIDIWLLCVHILIVIDNCDWVDKRLDEVLDED